MEYEGGGEETRSNPWLAELQQEMFVEVNPVDANNLGIKDGQEVWVEGAEKGRVKVKAMVTRRVKEGMAFMPFHFGGKFEGKDLRSKYPEGSDPYVVGEAANTATTYGYDPVTLMQETKVTLCKIQRSVKGADVMANMKFLCDTKRCIECNGCVTACKKRKR